MTFNYLMSILELYLGKEKEDKTNFNITKCNNDKIKINLRTIKSLNEKTTFYMAYDDLFVLNNIQIILKKYKSNSIIIDEKCEYNKRNDKSYYSITLANARILSFTNFSIKEINNIRNIIYDIKYYPDEIKIVLDEDTNAKNGYYRLNLGETGFTGYLTLFFVVLVVLSVLLITLWILNNFL